MKSSTETQRSAYEPEAVVVDLAKIAPQPGAALSTTSADQLMAIHIQLDPHDLFVTSRSVLGHAAGLAFLDALSRPGPDLADPPIPIEV